MASTTVTRMGSKFRLSDSQDMEQMSTLPVGNYVVGQDMFGFFLERVDAFEIPPKVYGTIEADVARFLSTYEDRTQSTGVLLHGEKGSGKSLTAKVLSVRAAEQGVITLLVNQPYCGDKFNEMLQRITQPCIVLFDEFEKVYASGSSIDPAEPTRNGMTPQQSLLTVLEGVYTSRKLFVFTSNDKYALDSHMLNRPGRIYYCLEYKGVEEDFIRGYCADNLKNAENVEGIVKLASMFKQFNFDMLKSIVEDMNRYNETALQVLRYLNIDCSNAGEDTFSVELVSGRKKLKTVTDTYAKPLSGLIRLPNYGRSGEDESNDFRFTPDDLAQIDSRNGVYVYVKDKLKLTLKRTEPEYSYSGLHRFMAA